jgi:beta-mannosidase
VWPSLALALVVMAASSALAEAEPGPKPHPDPGFAFAQVRDGSTPAALLDLGGDWQFRATGEEGWMEARVPSTVQTDLLRAGRLEDPFFRDRELDAQWVETKEWEYRRTFRLDRAFLEHDRILLECRGLDTIADVYLNGALVARTTNMFIEHEFEVKSRLREGENEIRIVFRRILEWIREQMDAEPRARVLCASGDEQTDCLKGLSFIARKEGSDFGWDWAPRLLTSGIWKPVRLAAYDAGRIADLAVRQDLSDPDRAVLDISARVERFSETPLSLDMEIAIDGERVFSRTLPISRPEVRERAAIREPRLWWPNGWGAQPLYTVRGRLRAAGRAVHEKALRIGLRTIEIGQHPDERGLGFGLKINGRLMFAKGANWIPLDVFPDRLTEGHYRQVLGGVRDANMNMLRVWGGGIYEPDVFYEFCDENGILIWHDFMFAVGPYIASPSYLENVRSEIENVVRRRRHHPSIALWCGNNESESSMAGGQRWLERYATVTWEDFDKVFYETIPETAARLDPDRPYWPGSPHHPLDRERKSPDWETASGDAHDWEVWHGGKPFAWFDELSRYRFVSEFGFESLPHIETIRSFTAPEDRFFNSYAMDHHEKTGRMTRPVVDAGSPNRGTSRIARYAAALFGMPSDLEDWVYVSQLVQAEGLRRGTEALRRNHPRSTGALYWQLGDNWPVISNSTIDHYGRWKAAHYAARRFFSAVLASAVVRGTAVAIWGVNDMLEEVPATLQWSLRRFDGVEVKRGSVSTTLPANRSARIAELSFAEEVGEPPGRRTYRNDSFARASRFYLWYALFRGDEELSSNVAFFAPFKYLQLEDPGLEVKVSEEGGELSVTVRAQRFAAFVELGVQDGYARFSDNDFHLLPGAERRIRVVESAEATDELRERIFVRSLVDSYGALEVEGTR